MAEVEEWQLLAFSVEVGGQECHVHSCGRAQLGSPLGICGFGRTKLEHEGGLMVRWVAVFTDWWSGGVCRPLPDLVDHPKVGVLVVVKVGLISPVPLGADTPCPCGFSLGLEDVRYCQAGAEFSCSSCSAEAFSRSRDYRLGCGALSSCLAQQPSNSSRWCMFGLKLEGTREPSQLCQHNHVFRPET